MTTVLAIAWKEVRDGLRNRWVLATTLLMAALALGLAFLGAAPTGSNVAASRLAVTVVSLASLTIFLVPLIALLLAYDALVGEIERGTMLLLLAYPVARWEIVAGKFLGHAALIAIATGVGYGVAAAAVAYAAPGTGAEDWQAMGALIASSILLGAVFLSIGYLLSGLVRERATAAGLAIAVWLVFVLLYDLGLLGYLAATEGKGVSAETFGWLLLLNPADAFRLFNLTGLEGVRQFSGMAGASGQAPVSPFALMAALLAWVLVPLLLAQAVFHRRQL
ncbi:ABC transporter permease [Azospirillum canadense]|uniref:ABC transporter permease n=1 Tax=Azospirillum canadense TaxID=403962 RepID=UPI002226EDA2|nr:ABC transporter permease [Azospirillum canadense]MCW2239049.1 Cu-processing system permease protein [Azospirillum canadense]